VSQAVQHALDTSRAVRTACFQHAPFGLLRIGLTTTRTSVETQGCSTLVFLVAICSIALTRQGFAAVQPCSHFLRLPFWQRPPGSQLQNLQLHGCPNLGKMTWRIPQLRCVLRSLAEPVRNVGARAPCAQLASTFSPFTRNNHTCISSSDSLIYLRALLSYFACARCAPEAIWYCAVLPVDLLGTLLPHRAFESHRPLRPNVVANPRARRAAASLHHPSFVHGARFTERGGARSAVGA
jgi:hypothetical protein